MPTRNAPLVGIDSARRRLIGGPDALLEGEEVGGVPLVLDRLESLIVIAIVGFLPVQHKKIKTNEWTNLCKERERKIKVPVGEQRVDIIEISAVEVRGDILSELIYPLQVCCLFVRGLPYC